MVQRLPSCLLLLFTYPFLAYAGNVPLPSFPLAVKSPYLSAWLPGNYGSNVAAGQPEFWAGQSLTWNVLARVNGRAYNVFGVPQGISGYTVAQTASITWTSSHTVIKMTAGFATITLDFFSPVLPGANDYLRQSLPYSYLTVSATSTKNDKVQILSAIDETWTAQNGAANLNYTTNGNTGLFWFHNPNEIPFTENSDMATYGSVIFATTIGSGVSSSCDSAGTIYKTFASRGSLSQGKQCGGYDLAALAKDLGSVGSSASSVTFAIGFDRAQAINYLGTTQTGLYRSKYATPPQAVSFFLSDYATTLSQATSFDSTVRSKAQSVSPTFGSQYADIVEASVRQTFGALELTVPVKDLGATPQVFLKEISSDGNLNTVDIIFQSWPIFYSLNPYYIRYYFEPILPYLQAGRWPHPWVIHDLGTHYPNATGHDDGNAEQMPLFETSTLFIMLYAYQKSTGDTSWAQQYLKLLEGYASYLAANSLYPASQLISVDAIAKTANQTALAMQSAIGLNAAAILTGNKTYSSIAASIAQKLYYGGLGLNGGKPADSTHFTYNYGLNNTWNVVFTAYSDVQLGLNTFPSSAWDLQSKWYLEQIQVDGLPWGVPSTSAGGAVTWGLSDWSKSIHLWGMLTQILIVRRYCRSSSLVDRGARSSNQHNPRLPH